ncbi:unnamed protein product [Mycena citricolor]|uniref:Uncharacterized protein n=1 Tax=Mycena citricolor TaxID=2018698 RepID=A0AAD2HU74_9AGAR|nr:unnamed protein product [Mycena citricolor]
MSSPSKPGSFRSRMGGVMRRTSTILSVVRPATPDSVASGAGSVGKKRSSVELAGTDAGTNASGPIAPVDTPAPTPAPAEAAAPTPDSQPTSAPLIASESAAEAAPAVYVEPEVGPVTPSQPQDGSFTPPPTPPPQHTHKSVKRLLPIAAQYTAYPSPIAESPMREAAADGDAEIKEEGAEQGKTEQAKVEQKEAEQAISKQKEEQENKEEQKLERVVDEEGEGQTKDLVEQGPVADPSTVHPDPPVSEPTIEMPPPTYPELPAPESQIESIQPNPDSPVTEPIIDAPPPPTFPEPSAPEEEVPATQPPVDLEPEHIPLSDDVDSKTNGYIHPHTLSIFEYGNPGAFTDEPEDMMQSKDAVDFIVERSPELKENIIADGGDGELGPRVVETGFSVPVISMPAPDTMPEVEGAVDYFGIPISIPIPIPIHDSAAGQGYDVGDRAPESAVPAEHEIPSMPTPSASMQIAALGPEGAENPFADSPQSTWDEVLRVPEPIPIPVPFSGGSPGKSGTRKSVLFEQPDAERQPLLGNAHSRGYDATSNRMPAGTPIPPPHSDLPGAGSHTFGWLTYTLPDGAKTYYVHPGLHLVTDVDLERVLRAEVHLENVLGEVWLRERETSGPNKKMKRKSRGREPGLVKWLVDHTRREVYRAGSDEKHAEMEYRYWSYMESHPAHASLGFAARKEAADVLTWCWADALLPLPTTQRPPFSQTECQELLGVLRSFDAHPAAQDGGIQSIVLTRLVSRILLRVADWRESEKQPAPSVQRIGFARRTADVLLTALLLGIPYMFYRNRVNENSDTESQNTTRRNALPVLVIAATSCLLAAVLLSAAVTLLTSSSFSPSLLLGLKIDIDAAWWAVLASALLAAGSMAAGLVALARVKAEWEASPEVGWNVVGPGRMRTEGMVVVSTPTFVKSLPLALLVYALIAFVVAVVLYSGSLPKQSARPVVTPPTATAYTTYARWTILGLGGAAAGVVVAALLVDRGRRWTYY